MPERSSSVRVDYAVQAPGNYKSDVLPLATRLQTATEIPTIAESSTRAAEKVREPLVKLGIAILIIALWIYMCDRAMTYHYEFHETEPGEEFPGVFSGAYLFMFVGTCVVSVFVITLMLSTDPGEFGEIEWGPLLMILLPFAIILLISFVLMVA